MIVSGSMIHLIVDNLFILLSGVLSHSSFQPFVMVLVNCSGVVKFC